MPPGDDYPDFFAWGWEFSRRGPGAETVTLSAGFPQGMRPRFSLDAPKEKPPRPVEKKGAWAQNGANAPYLLKIRGPQQGSVVVGARCSVGRGPRPRNLHIPRFRLTPKAHSFRCSVSPHKNRSAGFSWGPRNFRSSATRIGVTRSGKDWKDQRLMSLPLAWWDQVAAAGLVVNALQ